MVVNSKNYKPTNFTRFVVYPLVLVFFLVVLGYVLLFAKGYKPTFKGGQIKFAKTSMIIVGVKPGDAKIYLNNVYKKRTTLTFLTIKLTGLVPGLYDLRIEKPGYRTWQNKLSVVEDLVTWANYILLFPEELKFEDYEAPDYLELTQSRNGRHILYAKSVNDKFSLINFDTHSKVEKNIWPPQGVENYAWLKSPVVKSASFSINNDKVLLVIDNAGTNEYVVVESGIGDSRIYVFGPKEGFRETIRSVSWLDEDNNKIAFNTTNGLYINTSGFDQDLESPALQGDIVSYKYINPNNILYVKKDVTSQMLSLNRKSNGSNIVIDEAINLGSGYIVGESFDSKYVSVLNRDKKELVIYYNEAGKFRSTLLSDTAVGYFWNKNEPKLAYYSEKKVMTYDFIKNVETVFEVKNSLKQISWYYDESHFLVNDGSLFVVDYDGANKVEIDSSVVSSLYDKITNNIIILDQISAAGIKTYKKYIFVN